MQASSNSLYDAAPTVVMNGMSSRLLPSQMYQGNQTSLGFVPESEYWAGKSNIQMPPSMTVSQGNGNTGAPVSSEQKLVNTA